MGYPNLKYDSTCRMMLTSNYAYCKIYFVTFHQSRKMSGREIHPPVFVSHQSMIAHVLDYPADPIQFFF
jgi:hypothetical protein